MEKGTALNGQFIFGQYRPKDSFGHRLDPRGKILFVILLMILAVLTSSKLFYGLTIAGILILLVLSKINARNLLASIKPFVLMVAFTAGYHLIFSGRDTAPVLTFWGINITEKGLDMALIFSLRLIMFVVAAFFISLTIMPVDMAEVIGKWLKPFRKIGLPVGDIALIIFIAMRFIPVLAEEFDTIRKAQIVRGADFSGNLITRGKKMISLLIPILQSAVRRADELAVAIESRGYISGQERSSYIQLKYRPVDIMFILVSFTAVIFIFYYVG